jgi:Na+/H+ antiporter NhaD/arsenite permease-like protein
VITYLALAIFALIYLVIASQKIPYLHLDRPSGALAGAVLMVIAGVLSLDEAYQAINYDTITLLLGMMILVGYLRFARFFRYTAYWLLTRLHTGTQLLAGIIFKKSLIGKTWAKSHLAAPRVDIRLMRKGLIVLAGAMIGFLFSSKLALVSICAGTAIILWTRKPPSRAFEYIDWELLLFFCGLFIVMAGFGDGQHLRRQFHHRRLGGEHDRDRAVARSCARALLDLFQNRRAADAARNGDWRGDFGIVCDA